MNHYNSNGFTLLETLIALALLAIAVTGIYFLLNQSINIATYSNDKLEAQKIGFETVVKILNYPNTDLDQLSEKTKGVTVSLTKRQSIVNGIDKCKLKVLYKTANIVYIFYEKQ